MGRIVRALVMLTVAGCGGSSSTPAEAEAKVDERVEAVQAPTIPTRPELVVAPVEERLAGSDANDPCDAAAFVLPGGTVIAKVGGEPIRAEALGDDARDAEREALHAYCREVHRIREAATQRAVEDRLLDTAARAAGVASEEFVRNELEKSVVQPDEAEVLAFYDANKDEQAPPFEVVKGQVEKAIIDERSRTAYETLMGSLRKGSEVELLLPDVRPPPYELAAAEHSATFGPKDAKVHIVEFSDFECPYCAQAARAVQAVKQRFGDQVQLAYRHFPLSFHPAAQPAAELSQCAHEQGKFWAMHDEIFADQRGLNAEGLLAMTEEIGLDKTELDECMASGRARQQVEADLAKGREVGVRGTPSFYIDGRTYSGGTSPEELIAAVEAALAGA